MATDLARSIWRLRGYCEDCGKTKDQAQMQGAHIFGTGTYRSISSDLRNGICLCAGCHRKWTNNPEWRTFALASSVGKYYKTLLSIGDEGGRIDWEDRIDFLKEIKRAIEANEMTIETAREYEQ